MGRRDPLLAGVPEFVGIFGGPACHSTFSLLTGLPEMMSTQHPRNVVLTRENGRDCPNGACYYAIL